MAITTSLTSSSLLSPLTTLASLSAGVGPVSTERLLTSRSRSLLSPTTGGDRGYRGYIRIMSDATVNVSDTSIYATSIAGTGGTLDNAVNGGTYGGYASFLITGVQCQMNEKMQVTETFGDGEVYYYFGREPVAVTISGMLVDSVDNDWFTQWLYMYGQALRGTQTAMRYQLVKLVLPNMTLVGSIAGMSFSQSSEQDTYIPFQFQFMAKHVIPTPIVSSGTPLAAAASLINFSSVNSFLTQSGVNSLKTSLSGFLSSVSAPIAAISEVSTFVSSVANGAATELNGVSNAFYSVTATLTGLRASLFSPLYGVLSSLTKLVSSATTAVNAFDSVTNQINNVVRDITNITSQASGLVSMANFSILNGGAASLGSSNSNASQLSAIGALSNTQGSISASPATLFQYIQNSVSSGKIPASAPFLQNRTIASLSISETSLSKLAILNSGTPYTPDGAAYL